MEWHVTDTLELERSRLDLNLGLRNSVWFYNNAPCPGIGPVFSPKLYTLAILGIHFANEDENISAITAANAIEALSMKLTYMKSARKLAYRGIRAFERDYENPNFKYNFLKNSKNYVTNTYRQSTSRYLTEEFGAGLIKSGNKYSNYILSEKAKSIIHELPNIDIIKDWLYDRRLVEEKSLKKDHCILMFDESITKIEKQVYKEFLGSELSEQSFFKNCKMLRKKRYDAIKEDVKIKLDPNEAYLLNASETFFKIKKLIDNEVHQAGKSLENKHNTFIDVHVIDSQIKNEIKQHINEHLLSIEKCNLPKHQLNYISESQSLFSTLLNETDDKKFIIHLLKRAPDFFTVEGHKYRRAITYDFKVFNYDRNSNLNAEAYSIKNLSHQIKALA